MRLHEYEAKEILGTYGVPIPTGRVVKSPQEAEEIANKIGYPVVIKAQVLVGGRGLAGGVLEAKDPSEVLRFSAQILDKGIKGQRARSLLIEKKLEVREEIYLGVAVDGYEGRPVVLLSRQGGVRVEEVARTRPSEFISQALSVREGFYPYQARELIGRLGYRGHRLVSISKVLQGLVKAFYDYEALIAEINPLGIDQEGNVTALDAVLEVDNSAIKRLKHQVPDPIERLENPLEKRGREIGVTYVDLDGDIGIISSGAGLGMASMDLIGKDLRPANFLETGGGITEELLYRCMELIAQKPNLRAVLINIYGGINPIHEGAKGIVRYIREKGLKIPVVAKALGNRQEETWEILRSGGVVVVTETATEKAVEVLRRILDEKGGSPCC